MDGTRHSFVKHDQDAEIDPWEITNGVAGINAISRHLCYVGGLEASRQKPEDTRTPEQLQTMLEIISEVLSYAPKVKIVGHNQFAAKGCPSFFAPFWLEKMKVPECNIEWQDPYGYAKFFGNPWKRNLLVKK